MNANLTEMRKATADEQHATEGGGKFNIQDLLSRFFQNETLAPQKPTTPEAPTLVHEPTHQRA
jgi:hypothetical protein